MGAIKVGSVTVQNGELISYSAKGAVAQKADSQSELASDSIDSAIAGRSFEARSAQLDRMMTVHGTDAYLRANSAIESINTEVEKIQSRVKHSRPDIKDSNWDFVMSNGKLVVTGSLNEKDKSYLSNMLNGDKALVASVNSFTAAAVQNLETSTDNPSYNNLNPYTGNMENRTFYKVADQMNGTTSYKALLQSTKNYRNIAASGGSAERNSNIGQMGVGALDVLSSQLKSSNQKISMDGFTLDPIEGTLART